MNDDWRLEVDFDDAEHIGAEAARELVLSLAQQHGWKLEVDFKRWHTIADEWMDPDIPLPSNDAARKAEHEALIAAERRQVEENGHPELEGRADLPPPPEG